MRPRRNAHYVTTIKKLLLASAVCLLLNAATILFMPIAAESDGSRSVRWGLVIVGIVFWVTGALGYALLVKANYCRKSYARARLGARYTTGTRAGIITFFSTAPGAIADSVVVATLIAFLAEYTAGNINRYTTYVLLAVLIFSVNMHGVFNGRIYKTINYKRSTRRGEENG